MYEYISGTVAEATPAYAVIDAGGVGYYLHISCMVSRRKSNANSSAI